MHIIICILYLPGHKTRISSKRLNSRTNFSENKPNKHPKTIQYTTLRGDTSSRLLQLAQIGSSLNKVSLAPAPTVTTSTSTSDSKKEQEFPNQKPIIEDNENTETIFISQDQTVEIPGQNLTYVLITTAENEQQLVPVSKITNPDNKL